MSLTRSDLLRRAAAAGGATLAVGASGGLLVATAAAKPRDEDLAWVRFAVTCEYVSAEFYRQARGSDQFRGGEARTLERGTAAELAHLRAFETLLTENGEVPIEDADLEVVFPLGAFETRPGVISLGRRLLSLSVHAYLGALTTSRDEAVRRLFAQVATSDAEQLAWFAGLAGRTVTDPFPPVHGIDTAADALARYLP